MPFVGKADDDIDFHIQSCADPVSGGPKEVREFYAFLDLFEYSLGAALGGERKITATRSVKPARDFGVDRLGTRAARQLPGQAYRSPDKLLAELNDPVAPDDRGEVEKVDVPDVVTTNVLFDLVGN